MGRFKLSKNNSYWVRLEAGVYFSEGNVKGASTLQELQDVAYLEYWRKKYNFDVFPVKMIVEAKNKRRFCYSITVTGNVRTSK